MENLLFWRNREWTGLFAYRNQIALPSGGDFLYLQTTLIVVCSIYIRDVPLKGVRHEQIGKT